MQRCKYKPFLQISQLIFLGFHFSLFSFCNLFFSLYISIQVFLILPNIKPDKTKIKKGITNGNQMVFSDKIKTKITKGRLTHNDIGNVIKQHLIFFK